jgi:membrane-associated phospholipid phosphatase
VVAKYWGWEAGVAAYTLGTVTALARVEGGYHYPSDVLAGATLGILIGNAVVYAPKDVTVSAGPGQINLKLAFN